MDNLIVELVEFISPSPFYDFEKLPASIDKESQYWEGFWICGGLTQIGFWLRECWQNQKFEPEIYGPVLATLNPSLMELVNKTDLARLFVADGITLDFQSSVTMQKRQEICRYVAENFTPPVIHVLRR